MRNSLSLPLVCLFICSLQISAAETPTYRTTAGAELIHDQFDSDTLPSHWRIAKGAWSIVDGAVEGKEKESDMHGGVLTTKQNFTATIIACADIRFEGARLSSLVFNGPEGHICRVSITEKGFSVSGEKNKNIADDKSVSIGKVEQSFTKGQWYHFTIEITGDEILVYTDDKHVVYGKDAKIGREKNAFAITVAKESIRWDNVCLRTAEPLADWSANKAKLGIP